MRTLKARLIIAATALALATLPGAAFPANAGSQPDKATHRAALDIAIYAATMTPPHRCHVPLTGPIDALSYWVGVIINRTDIPVFAVDTGFTGSLTIPRGFIDALRADGTLTKLDRNGPLVTSTLADGSEITEETIIVREIILPGCRAFHNVHAIITPDGSTPLLGQGILSSFSSAGIDHKERSLILVPEGLPADE
jgi:predicted aspartyl protease